MKSDGPATFPLSNDSNPLQWQVLENQFAEDEQVTLWRILSRGAGLNVHGFPGYHAGSMLPTLRQVLGGSKPANTAAIRVEVVPGAQSVYEVAFDQPAKDTLSDQSGTRFIIPPGDGRILLEEPALSGPVESRLFFGYSGNNNAHVKTNARATNIKQRT